MELATWKDNVLSVVKEISDETFQTRVWLRGEGPEVSSFEEAINRLFDDYLVEDFIEEFRKEHGAAGWLDRLQDLRVALDAYADATPRQVSPSEVLSDPRWSRIRALAQDVLRSP